MINSFGALITIIGLLIIGIATMTSCNRHNASVTSDDDKRSAALAYASDLLGKKTLTTFNKDQTLILCHRIDNMTTRYAVMDMNQNMILDVQHTMGNVTWHSNTSLAVQDRPRVMEDKSSKPQDHLKIIDLSGKQKQID